MYKGIKGTRTAAFLSGFPRFDKMYEYKPMKGVEYIGIAINEIDDMTMVADLCDLLRKNNFNKIILRPHPACPLPEEAKRRFADKGITLSDPRGENPFAYLSKLRLLIANESGIHLDAFLMGIPSVMFNFSRNCFRDYYSFVKNGVTLYCETMGELLKECGRPHAVQKRIVKEWNAAYGTRHEGHISEVVAHFIKIIANDANLEEYTESVFSYNKEGFYEYK